MANKSQKPFGQDEKPEETSRIKRETKIQHHPALVTDTIFGNRVMIDLANIVEAVWYPTEAAVLFTTAGVYTIRMSRVDFDEMIKMKQNIQ